MDSSVDWKKFTSESAEWTRRTAPMVLTLLLDILKKKSGPISYTDLAEALEVRYGEPVQFNKQKYGNPLGAAADAAIFVGDQHGLLVPPLSLIVINANTGLPGRGADQFVPRLRGKNLPINGAKRRTIVQEEVEHVWSFGTRNWTKLEGLLGLSPLPEPRISAKLAGAPPKPPEGGKGEGVLHKALKLWVSANPQKFKEFGSFESGRYEAPLQSGDRLDALLIGETSRLGIEVKASNATENELIRGVFQCVKYQSTMLAEASAYPNHFLPGRCILVSTRPLTVKAKAIATKLGVRFVQLDVRCERPQRERAAPVIA